MAKNIVLLYGKRACSHLPKMLSNWSFFFNSDAWQSCCFVLVTDEPDFAARVPSSAAAHVQNHIVSLPCDGLAKAAGAVRNFAKETIKGNNPVMLYVICSDSGEGTLDGAALSTFMNNLCTLYLNNIHPVIFNLLTTDTDASAHQKKFLSSLCENEMHKKTAFYLLSDTDEKDNPVDAATQWAALDNELGRSIKHGTNIIPGSVYSLGYVALNPDQKELASVQQRALLEQIFIPHLDGAKSVHPGISIWQLISGNSLEIPDGESQNDRVIEKWIRWMIGDSIVMPDEVKRKNNRILGAIYSGQLDLQRYSRHILQFYRMNTSSDKFEERAEAYFSKSYASMLSSPDSLFLAQQALDMLNILQQKLNFFANAELSEFVVPAMESKRFLEPEASYRDRCCEAIENKAKEYCYNEAIQKMAAIMCQKLERFKAFCNGRKNFTLPFDNKVISHGEYVKLQRKYQKYSNEIQTQLSINAAKLDFKLRQSEYTLFTPEGAIETENWHKMLDELLEEFKKIRDDSRTYLQVVSDENNSVQLFTDFLNHYLGDTARMLFYNGGDAAIETLYFVDDDLQDHSWTLGHRDEAFVVDNDNVERVDRYTILVESIHHKTILDLLNINDQLFPYFRDTGDSEDMFLSMKNESGGLVLKPLDLSTAAEDNDNEPPEVVQSSTETANKNQYDMGLTLLRDKESNRCAVCWQWPPHTTGMTLIILQNGRTVQGPYPVTAPSQRYVVDSLPYGEIRIVMQGHSTDGKNYWDENYVAGMQDRLAFRIENADHCKVRVMLRGRTTYLNEVFLKNTAPDGSNTYYPIATQETGIYENLLLQGNTQLVVDPRLKHPRVRVIQY